MQLIKACCFSILILGLISGVKLEIAEVPLQESIQFSCEKTVSSSPILYWAVTLPDNILYRTFNPADSLELQRKGIVVEQTSDSSHSNLTILASLENNGTSLACREILLASELQSIPITLVVIGPPLPPPLLTATAINVSHLLLEWERPFTWPGHNITGYDIQTEMPGGVLETVVEGISSQYYLFSPLDSDELVVECVPLIFKVSAISDLGESQPASITTGLPIFPGNFRSSDVQVRFQPNGMPEVTITMEPPQICEYEMEAEIMLVLRVEGESASLSVKTQTYSGQTPQVLVQYHTGLEADKSYDLSITAITAAGNASTTIKFNTKLEAPESSNSEHLLLVVVISVCASIVTVLVVALLLSIIICVKCRRHQKGSPTDYDEEEENVTDLAIQSNYSVGSTDTKHDLSTV